MSRLQEIRERLEAATPGPWLVDGMDSGHSKYEMDIWIVNEDNGDQICAMDGLARAGNDLYKDYGGADAWFIAHSRDDVEALLGAVEGVLAYVDACIDNDIEVDAPVVKWFIEKMLQEKESK